MMVEVWTRKRLMADGDENDVEDTSRYEKSGYDLPDWVANIRKNYISFITFS